MQLLLRIRRNFSAQRIIIKTFGRSGGCELSRCFSYSQYPGVLSTGYCQKLHSLTWKQCRTLQLRSTYLGSSLRSWNVSWMLRSSRCEKLNKGVQVPFYRYRYINKVIRTVNISQATNKWGVKKMLYRILSYTMRHNCIILRSGRWT